MEPQYLSIQNLKITVFQAYLFWENTDKNLQNLSLKLADGLREKTDLIVLPEMFNTGFTMNAEKLAETMKGWMLEGNDVVLAIGGPDGHSEAVRKAAAWHWSLSKLTLPHPLVRVMLIEQLYRAMSINHNHPYHRAG